MMMSPAGKADQPPYDIAIIGGGINGAGIARDAAGRGHSVILCEAGDFGSGTSSASTKLIHGGLRYLEHYEFRLVRESLIEREVLWQLAPHIIRPMRFVLPYHKGLRPAWLLRIGLFMYDHLGGRKLLPATRSLDLRTDAAGAALKPVFEKGFEYSDCWVEDSRLVILNLMDARDRGADIRAGTRITSARYKAGVWHLVGEDRASGEKLQFSARTVVNAAGPWVDRVLQNVFGRNNAHNVRLVRGSHIVIRRKFAHERSYIFQNTDGRIIFAIPYEQDYTLIGTTDSEHGEEMHRAEISTEETRYLCEMASQYFRQPVVPDDVVWTYSGVRPLFDDGATKAQEATRDYVIRADKEIGNGSLFNIFGGKITTYRKLAESIMDEIGAAIGERGSTWTATAKLPGGDFPATGLDQQVEAFCGHYPFLPDELAHRLVRLYGTRAGQVVGKAENIEDLGRGFGCGLYEAEVRYLMFNEWARTAEDVAFRRTKLGIGMTREQIQDLDAWMTEQLDDMPDPARNGARTVPERA